MVLYHIVTTYHLLCAMTHAFSQEKETVALCSTWIHDKYPNDNELNRFFDRVIYGDFNYRFNHTKEQTEKYFISLIGAPKQYTEIYVWGAQFSFGFMLNDLKVPYIYCEEAAGMLTRGDVLRNIEKRNEIKSRFWEQCDAYGAYDGSGENVSGILCNTSAQIEGFCADERIENFDVVSELIKLPKEQREEILSFFAPPCGMQIPKKSTLLLTQHFTNLGATTFEGQVLLYQMLVDYFFERANLVFKPHPDDLMYYSQLFPEARVIRERFPSEFIPFIFDNQPECVATVSSTAIFNLRGHYPRVFELDTRYESDFPMTHRYYAAMMIAMRLGLDVVCHGANELLARRLCETLGENAPTVFKEKPRDGRPYLLLIDDVTAEGEAGRDGVLERLEGLDAASCAVMINSRADYCWYRYERRALWENIAPFVLTKAVREPRGEDFYASTEDEVIFIYSKSREVLKLARETEIEKDLPHVGITVKSVKLDEKDEKIRMLEGILEATEKRLLYYIEKERGEK